MAPLGCSVRSAERGDDEVAPPPAICRLQQYIVARERAPSAKALRAPLSYRGARPRPARTGPPKSPLSAAIGARRKPAPGASSFKFALRSQRRPHLRSRDKLFWLLVRCLHRDWRRHVGPARDRAGLAPLELRAASGAGGLAELSARRQPVPAEPARPLRSKEWARAPRPAHSSVAGGLRRQAPAAGRHTSSGSTIPLVVSSDLARARSTAEIVASVARVGVSIEPGLRERNVGLWTGLTSAEVE